MTAYVYPVLFALFVWWFSTGVIIYLDLLPRHTFKWSMLGATVVQIAAFYGLATSAWDRSVEGAYLAFACGLLTWGWQEISFYMGVVTGPRKEACPESCTGWRHFLHGIEVCLYHELAIIAASAVVVALTWNAPNQVGTWTFLVLWWMHESAKLNVFFGVLNLNEQFLPDHLHFLRRYLSKKPMNLFFPVSVTISTIVAVVLVQRAIAPGAAVFDVTAFTFVSTLMILAILEHWFLVLPIPAAALWNWGTASKAIQRKVSIEIVSGALGAGKTSVVRQRLLARGSQLHTVVLIDDPGTENVSALDLPDGSLACRLQTDLVAQISDVVDRLAPQRILVEPSGVADLVAVLRALDDAALRPKLGQIDLCSVIDAATFLRDYLDRPEQTVAQARLSPMIVVNKTDTIAASEIAVIRRALASINPSAVIVDAVHGAVTSQSGIVATPRPVWRAGIAAGPVTPSVGTAALARAAA